MQVWVEPPMKRSISAWRVLALLLFATGLGACGNKSDLVRPGAPGAPPDARETPVAPEAVPPADGKPATEPARGPVRA